MALGYKTGGRQKGTPNKPNPIKEHLRAASSAYFEAKPQANPDGTPRTIDMRTKEGEVYKTITLADRDGNPLVMSDFDIDLMLMEPKDRAAIQEKLLRYHTPQMQSVAAELSLDGNLHTTIEQRLKTLAEGDTAKTPET